MTDGSRWATDRVGRRGADYDEQWRRLAATGKAIHGEVEFVMRFDPASVLDAGCGTGRVAIELASRGVDAVGVDLDPSMLDVARSKQPDLRWVEESIETVDLGRRFDVVVMAGNVIIFVTPGTEAAVLGNLAAHLAPDGVLVAGFQLDRSYGVDDYARDCAEVGLVEVERHAGWDGERWDGSGGYVVSVHRWSDARRPADGS